MLSDGTCATITIEIVQQIFATVQQKKAALGVAQAAYDTAKNPNCTACPYEHTYFDMRRQLLLAHKDYNEALRLLLAAMDAMQIESKDEEAGGDVDDTKDKGPEFKMGVRTGRPHCESWTVNETVQPTFQLCGVICRNQPSCIGFSIDPVSNWCVWYDEAPSAKASETCSATTETRYTKLRQGKFNKNLWATMEKIHMFNEAIAKALEVATEDAGSANATLVAFSKASETTDNVTEQERLEKLFVGATANYSGTMHDVFGFRQQWDLFSRRLLAMALGEAQKHPPVPVVKPSPPPPPPPPVVESFAEPLSDAPKTLRWKDFPNSQDTAWSQMHPDCPMGTPCFCDCKCRGPPPQNFIEPPPAPVMPCPPPPPLPSPFQLSVAMR